MNDQNRSEKSQQSSIPNRFLHVLSNYIKIVHDGRMLRRRAWINVRQTFHLRYFSETLFQRIVFFLQSLQLVRVFVQAQKRRLWHTLTRTQSFVNDQSIFLSLFNPWTNYSPTWKIVERKLCRDTSIVSCHCRVKCTEYVGLSSGFFTNGSAKRSRP